MSVIGEKLAELGVEVSETRGAANSAIAYIQGQGGLIQTLRDEIASVGSVAEAVAKVDEFKAANDAIQADLIAAIPANPVPGDVPPTA